LTDEPSIDIDDNHQHNEYEEQDGGDKEIDKVRKNKLQFIDRVEELDESMEKSRADDSISLQRSNNDKEHKYEKEKHEVIQRQEFQEALEDIF
jgi:hypothetical protein